MQPAANPMTMKEQNRIRVRQALLEKREATKQQLAELTGLSAVTAGAVLGELAARGEVFATGFIPSKGGRPAQNYRYNRDFRQVLVIYLHVRDGQDIASYRVVNLFGETVDGEDIVMDRVDVSSFEAPIAEFREVYPAIGALGFGLPGFEFQDVMMINDHEALQGASFTEHYRRISDLPVVVENDANLAAIGCCRRHPEVTSGTMVYLYFPMKYEPGVGLCFHGRVHRGMGNFAGEVCFLPLQIDWYSLDYSDFNAVCGAITKLMIVYIATVNPDYAVVSGSFVTAEHLQEIRRRCADEVGESLVPELLCSHDYGMDYEIGLRRLTLEALPAEN